MKQVLQNMQDGKSTIENVPVPQPSKGTALVRTAASIVSAGTERMVVEFAEKSLMGKATSRPDLVKQVLDKARREGILQTIDATFNRLSQPMVLGYSSAGTIVALGEDMEGFQVGQRVACAGGNHAVHAEFGVIPKNLLTPLPDNVSFEEAAFTTLGAIALHGFRLSEPQLGEKVCIIGLGLLGLLAVEIANAAGCEVYGVDLNPERVALANQLGAKAFTREMAEDAISNCDIVLICADTASNDPVTLAPVLCRDRARVVAVGAVGLDLPRRDYYMKEISFINSRSYGPGRYDDTYEEEGIDYPIGFIRWTEGRNMQAIVDLMASGKMDVTPLISHRFPIEEAAEAYDLITEMKTPFLGVLLKYAENAPVERKIAIESTKTRPAMPVKLGILGAGNFASATMLPALKKNNQVELVSITSGSGVNAKHLAKKFNIQNACSTEEEILTDPTVNTVAILTRHNLHYAQTMAALRAGKNVFCEKPLGLTLEQIETIQKEASREDAPYLMVGFNRRFAPLAQKMKTFIEKSTEPKLVHYRVNAGFIPANHWTQDAAQGGGRIIGEGCHFIDFVAHMIGAKMTSIQTVGLEDGTRYHEDNVHITMEFEDGSIGLVTYLANGDKAFAKERVEVFTGGRIAVLNDYRSLELVANGSRKVEKSRLRQDKGHAAEWIAFAQAIATGSPPPISLDDLITVSKASILAVESLRDGEKKIL